MKIWLSAKFLFSLQIFEEVDIFVVLEAVTQNFQNNGIKFRKFHTAEMFCNELSVKWSEKWNCREQSCDQGDLKLLIKFPDTAFQMRISRKG